MTFSWALVVLHGHLVESQTVMLTDPTSETSNQVYEGSGAPLKCGDWLQWKGGGSNSVFVLLSQVVISFQYLLLLANTNKK